MGHLERITLKAFLPFALNHEKRTQMCFCSVSEDPCDAKTEESEQNSTGRCCKRATRVFLKVCDVHVEAEGLKSDRNGSGGCDFGLLLTSNMSAVWHLWHNAFFLHVMVTQTDFIPSHWVCHTETRPAYIWMSWGAATKPRDGATNRREVDWMIWPCSRKRLGRKLFYR